MVHRPRTEECIGALAQAIRRDFCGLDQLKEKVNAAALAIQGSGWVWLVCPLRSLLRKAQRDTAQGYKADSLIISTTKDQDPLIDATVLFGIDMWCVAPSLKGDSLTDKGREHAFCALYLARSHITDTLAQTFSTSTRRRTTSRCVLWLVVNLSRTACTGHMVRHRFR